MLEALWDAVLDTVRILPFLYLTYLAMEYLEHRLSGKSGSLLRRAGRLGPLWGGLLGAVPQCGFSAAAAGLYAGRVISLGTLLAVFLSTSDEMLPLLLTHRTPAGEILKILGLKAAAGVAAGFLVDLALRRPAGKNQIEALCHDEGCNCNHRSIFLAALYHMLEIAVFLLLVNLAVGVTLELIGPEILQEALSVRPVLSIFLAALVGLLPNCAASVTITTLYLEGLLPFGAMMSGLLVSAGVGLLVLFRVNRRPKENLAITGLLYGLGVAVGGVMQWIK